MEVNQPDVLLFQELKGMDFPAEDFKQAGYTSFAVPQKGRNGVAALVKDDATLIQDTLDPDDEQARYVEIEYHGLRIIGIYAPNGNPVDSEKYPYKLAWMDHLKSRIDTLLKEETPFVIGGDFNIIPEERDCHNPAEWREDALFRTETRRVWRGLLNRGLIDAFRVFNHKNEQYSFWDYQAGAWPQNKGIRIDHFLLSPAPADKLKNCVIDSAPRGWEKPSDHTPIMIELNWKS